MILNDRSLKLAKARASQLKQEIAASAFYDLKSQLSAEILEVRRKALSDELERVSAQVRAYEHLKGNSLSNEDRLDTAELGLLPILGRIAKGLSQRQLAELLQLKEQQIQRYESDRYRGISLSRYELLLEALDISLTPEWKKVSLVEQESKDIELALANISSETLREIDKRNWFDGSCMDKEAQRANLLAYTYRAKKLSGSVALHRKSSSKDRQINEAALCAWQARLINLAHAQAPRIRKRFNLADTSWLGILVSLSMRNDGPRQAADFLLERGIVVVIESHLTGTRVDGAAMVLSDGTPIVGLSLRYDRLDSFWFTLLHELGHIFLHFNGGLSEGFFDDLEEAGEQESAVEREANSFARSALIPDEVWNTSPARFAKSIEPIRAFATKQRISLSIVVGRIRRERRNYALFSQYLGQGKVRGQFLGVS